MSPCTYAMVYRNEISYQEIEYFDPYGSTTTGIVVGPYVFVDSHLPIDSTFCVIYPTIVTSSVLI